MSGASLRQLFHHCELSYILGTCKGRCCEGSGGILVTIHPTETDRIERLGATVEGGFIKADPRGLCPFKTDAGLCSIHGEKPFGCAVSPFTLNKGGTLIVRNRYRLLKCYKCAEAVPAYVAHRRSLEVLFGDEEAVRVCGLAKDGVGIFHSAIDVERYQMLVDNDIAKKARGKAFAKEAP